VCSGYGNWLVPDQTLSTGLAPLVDYTHRKGMLFGLYVEPEGGRDGFTSGDHAPPRSSEPKQGIPGAPDWFIDRGNIVNLSIPESAAYRNPSWRKSSSIIAWISICTTSTPSARQGAQPLRDGFAECEYWRHHDALYRAFQRIHASIRIWFSCRPRRGLSIGPGHGRRFSRALRERSGYVSEYVPDAERVERLLPPETLVAANGMAWPRIFRTSIRHCVAPLPWAILPGSSTRCCRRASRTSSLRRGRSSCTTTHLQDFYSPMLPRARSIITRRSMPRGSRIGRLFAMEFTAPDGRRAGPR